MAWPLMWHLFGTKWLSGNIILNVSEKAVWSVSLVMADGKYWANKYWYTVYTVNWDDRSYKNVLYSLTLFLLFCLSVGVHPIAATAKNIIVLIINFDLWTYISKVYFALKNLQWSNSEAKATFNSTLFLPLHDISLMITATAIVERFGHKHCGKMWWQGHRHRWTWEYELVPCENTSVSSARANQINLPQTKTQPLVSERREKCLSYATCLVFLYKLEIY